MTMVDATTLREWLESGRPVTIVDVRGDADRTQWSIPGSVHVNAYGDLRSGTAGPLATIELPSDRPVVTVCNAGRLSQVAASYLSARGYDARSLDGGMKAWSLAWNMADVTTGDETPVIQMRRAGKGCLSYIVGSEGTAAVIDASLPDDVYLAAAAARGWRIAHVLDTHVHADHLSRARRLAERAGARLWLPPDSGTQFSHARLAEGDIVGFGKATLTAMHTPGHTNESTSLMLNRSAVFTGDTLLTHGVGRPDLHADVDQVRARAAALYASLARLRQLPPQTRVLPGHHSEPIPFDGEPIATTIADAERWLSGWLTSEDAFVARVMSAAPPAPANFVRITDFNRRGEWPEDDVAELEAGANRCALR